MSDYAYDDDSDDAVDQDNAPADTTALTQDDAGAATDLPDVTGGYDMSTDPLMMDYVMNGTGSWPSGDYDMSNDPLMTDYVLNGSGGWPPATDNGSSDAGAAPVNKSVPIVPSDSPGGAPSGPAVVQTLADTAGGSGPATYVPIVANTGAGLASLSNMVGSNVVQTLPSGDDHDFAPRSFDSGLAGSDDLAAQQGSRGLRSDPSQPTGSADLLDGRRFAQTPGGDWSLQSDASASGDGASLADVVDRQGAQPSSSGQAAAGRPGPSERDPLAARLARQSSTTVLGFHVDPSTGVVTRITTGQDGSRVLVPANAMQKQIVLEQMLGVQNFAVGQMSRQEAAARAALHAAGSDEASPLTDQGIAWLQGREQNSVDLTRRTSGNPSFDDASKTYTDSTGHVTFGYGHVLTDADARNGLTVASLAQMNQAQKQDLAERLFAEDVQTHHDHVVARLGQNAAGRLNPNQVDALIGDDFNAGGRPALGPNMLRDIRAGDLQAAGGEFNAWNGGGQMQPGLVVRSLEEQRIWQNRDYRLVDGTRDPEARRIIAAGGRPGQP